ncbi:MAG: hypothetical protein ACD_77C00384G0003 [uncultured bacterium]|nr:MAG: hypothetical protein ACD_77C00384G0003 [uncultured bacterium]
MASILKTLKFFTISIIVFTLCLPLAAQNRERSFRDRMKAAIQLYDRALYPAAINEINDAVALSGTLSESELAKAGALSLLCSIELQKPNIEGLVKEFLDKYPFSSEKETIRLKLAGYYFRQQDYVTSLDILQKINSKYLAKEHITEYNFQLAYCNMRTGRLVEAERLFELVLGAKYSTFSNPSQYYIAYIRYMQKDFKKAIELFGKIEKDPRFSTLARYYSLESQFMLKNYEVVTSKGEELFLTLSGEFKNKLARILSEAYFATGNVEKANFYFGQFSFTNKELSRKDIYYSGIIAYSMKNYELAIQSFVKLNEMGDTLSQNALYHMGHSYIQTKNKQAALVAFRSASRFNFDPLIREDAMFNYAKLSFDINSDINVFRQYLNEFSPVDSKYNEIQNYIATSLIVSKDYKGASDVLKLIRFPQPEDIINLQKVSFLRGMQQMEIGAFRDAIPNFELSVTNGNYNVPLQNLAKFWLAEALYRDNQFSRSVETNLSLVNNNIKFKSSAEYPTALYNLGYGYFKLSNFSAAELWFTRYLSAAGRVPQYGTEAKLRLGDVLFMQRKYAAATDLFSQVSKNDINAYAYANYQMAISQGLLGNDSKKVEFLKSILQSTENSKMYPEILYELGRTLVQTGDNIQAKKYFRELGDRYQESSYYPKALLELGLIALNQNQNDEAVQYYKQILAVSPQSQEAQNAIAGLENIYQEKGETEDFLDYLDKSGLSKSRSTDDRELLIFNSAEKQYLSGNYTSAINSFTSFLSRHPNSSKKSQANFYLGESYNKTGKPELAIDHFKKVMESGEGSFLELATLNYSKISYNLENYKQALEGYSSLMLIARLDNNRTEAQLGRLNSFFMDRQWENAVAESKRIDTRSFSESAKTRINYITAKSLYSLGERSAALPILKELSKNKITAEGAESAYLLISNSFDNGDFASVEKETFAFSDSNTPQSYWLAKCFILLGDTYAEKENWEQAKATYESILESYNAKGTDDIADQIKMRLSKIEKMSPTK